MTIDLLKEDESNFAHFIKGLILALHTHQALKSDSVETHSDTKSK